MKPKFSIVIPFFNAEATLREALESVSAQTYREFEVILVNDGSTDKSGKIASDWSHQNPEIDVTVVTQKNGGLGNARNRGIAKASHTWLALLDADDKWEKHKLEVFAETIQQTPSDIYYHPVQTFGLKQGRTRPCPVINSVRDILVKGNSLLPSAVVGKTFIFQEYGFCENPNYHGAEDLFLWISLLNDNILFQKVNQPLTHYRESGGMSTDIEKHLANVFHVLHFFYQKDYFGQQLLARAKRRKYLEVARFYHKRKNFKNAELYYSRADFKSMKILGFRILSFLGIAT